MEKAEGGVGVTGEWKKELENLKSQIDELRDSL